MYEYRYCVFCTFIYLSQPLNHLSFLLERLGMEDIGWSKMSEGFWRVHDWWKALGANILLHGKIRFNSYLPTTNPDYTHHYHHNIIILIIVIVGNPTSIILIILKPRPDSLFSSLTSFSSFSTLNVLWFIILLRCKMGRKEENLSPGSPCNTHLATLQR